MDQGADFNITVTLQDSNGNPLDLTGYTGKSFMRQSFNSDLNVFALNVSILSPTTAGNIGLNLPYTSTSVIPAGRYAYDVLITNGTLTSRVLQGIMVVNPAATISSVDVNIGAIGSTGIPPSVHYGATGATSFVYWKYDPTTYMIAATGIMPGV